MSNIFLDRENEAQGRVEDLHTLLLQIMQQEYPDDPRYANGRTYVSDPTSPVIGNNNEIIAPTTEIIESTRNQNHIVELNAENPVYTKYNLDKKLPTIDEDDMDDLLDDEWDFYLDDIGVTKPRIDGLFLINQEIDLNPPDFHHAYITRGPSEIDDRLNNGEEADNVIKTTFCVFFIVNNVALPIPNYKTLEVMLVERNKTYNDILEATPEQVKEFDLAIDGIFKADLDGDIDPVEEFRFRQMLDRTISWNERIRFDSGYRPGFDNDSVQFIRDPGDYLKPRNQRDNGLYNDKVYQKQTYREKLREKFEGKLIALQWPIPYDVSKITLQKLDTSQTGITPPNNLISDDKIFYIRMMINGYWKQVISLNVLRQYALINNLSLAEIKLDEEIYGPAENRTFLYNEFTDNTGAVGVAGLYGVEGIINLLLQNGGIEVLQDFDVNSSELDSLRDQILLSISALATLFGGGTDNDGNLISSNGTIIFTVDEMDTIANNFINEIKSPGWSDFPHIAEVDRLDTGEYQSYLDNYNNGGEPFEIDYLKPYEPAGSIKYYPVQNVANLQEQANTQAAVNQIKKQIEELLPELEAKASDLDSRLRAQPANYFDYVISSIGPDSDIYKVLFTSKNWKWIKRKNNGTFKDKNSDKSFFRLVEKTDAIFRKMSKSEEKRIFFKSGTRDFVRNIYEGSAAWNSGEDITGYLDLLCKQAWLDGAPKYNEVGSSLSGNLITDIPYMSQDYLPAGVSGAAGLPLTKGNRRLRRLLKSENYMKLILARYTLLEYAKVYEGSLSARDAITVFEKATLIDDAIPNYKSTVDNALAVLKDIDNRLVSSNLPEEFQSIFADLQQLDSDFNAVDFGVFRDGEDLRVSIDDFVKYMILQQYESIEYVRKKAYYGKRFLVWPRDCQQVVEAYYPGKKFDNHQPDDYVG